MSKIAIVIHGGAGPDSDFIHEHEEEYHQALREAVEIGYKILEKGGKALDAVEQTVRYLEDNPLFNAGRGSALTEFGHVEMCASIMEGKDRKSGAAAIVKNIKNPITLARTVMEKTNHVYMGNMGATLLAIEHKLEIMPEYYFMTQHQLDVLLEEHKKKGLPKIRCGTVGAVACDKHGDIAAATSTGGTENSKEGRIGDSSMIGIGSYANNQTCAVSTTGDGEYSIRGVAAYDVSAVMEYKKLGIEEACRFVVHEKNKDIEGDMGIIAVDREGNMGISYNSERMHRAWKIEGEETETHIYGEK
jgi:beta-aspartyl-peptidase (threonine type)